MLATGASISRLHNLECNPSNSTEDDDDEWVGAALTVFTCALSAFGGVYHELLLKTDATTHSLHLQNLLVYSWGVVINGIAPVWNDDVALKGGLLHGYSVTVWALVINNAFNGLAISSIVKHLNSIVKCFAHTCSMILSMIIETCLQLNLLAPSQPLSVIVVASSMYLYVHDSKKVERIDDDVAAIGLVVETDSLR